MPFGEYQGRTGARADLLAFLRGGDQDRGPHPSEPLSPDEGDGQHEGKGSMKAMGGMMGGGRDPNLKSLEPTSQRQNDYPIVATPIASLPPTARARSGNATSFMTDTSKDGPEKNAPAIMPAGMMGDRAAIIFAEPGEIGRFIEPHC